MTNAVIYARYSSDNQNAISIDKQLDFCREYAERNGYNVVEEYCDRAITGTDDKRPEFQRMIIDASKNKFEIVLVYTIDRFSRNVGQQAYYEKKINENGIELKSATESFGKGATGFLQKGVMLTFAEYYSLSLAEKLKDGFKVKIKKMQNTGQATFCGGTLPYGYYCKKDTPKSESVIYKNEEQAEVINQIYDLFISGLGYKKIVEKLNEQHIKNRIGKPFTIDNIRNILKYEPYTGVFIRKTNISDMFYNKSRSAIKRHYLEEQRVEDCMPVIISKEKFEAAQKIIKKHSREGKELRAKKLYLLSGKIYCAKCGRVMIGHNNGSRAYYSCPKRVRDKQCDTCCLRKETIESLVIDFLEKVVTEKQIKQMVDFLHKEQTKVLNSEQQQLKLLKKSLAATQSKIDRLVASLMNIDGDSSYISKTIVELEKDEAELKNKINAIEATSDFNKEFITKEEIAKYISSVVDIRNKTDEQKKKVIETLIDRIEITSYLDNDPNNKKKPTFDVKVSSSLGQLCVKNWLAWANPSKHYFFFHKFSPYITKNYPL